MNVTNRGKEHVVEIDERFNVPTSIERQANWQQEDEIAKRKKENASDVDTCGYGVFRICTTVTFVAFNEYKFYIIFGFSVILFKFVPGILFNFAKLIFPIDSYFLN